MCFEVYHIYDCDSVSKSMRGDNSRKYKIIMSYDESPTLPGLTNISLSCGFLTQTAR